MIARICSTHLSRHSYTFKRCLPTKFMINKPLWDVYEYKWPMSIGRVTFAIGICTQMVYFRIGSIYSVIHYIKIIIQHRPTFDDKSYFVCVDSTRGRRAISNSDYIEFAANQTKLKMSDTAVLASTALVMLSVDLDVEWIVWLIEKSLKLNAFYVLMLLKIYVATVNHSKWKKRIMYVWVQQLFSLYMWRLWYAFRLPWNQRLLKQTNNMNGSSHQHNAKLQTVSYQMIHLYTVMAVCHLSGWQATLNVRYKWHIFNEHPNNRFSHKHRI